MKSHKKIKNRDFKENGSQPGSWKHFHFDRKNPPILMTICNAKLYNIGARCKLLRV